MSSGDAAAAAVYAHALFDAAGADASAVLGELESLVESAHDSPETWQLLLSPQLDREQLKSVLERTYEGGHATTRNVLKVLVDHGRLPMLPDVVEQLRALVQLQQKQLDVKITTAIELPDALQRRLEERLSSSTGTTVRLHPTVDPSIIGGLVVQHGDTLIDTSLRSRLEQLRVQLSRGPRGTSTPSPST